MIKKLMIGAIGFGLSSSLALAGSVYFGANLGGIHNTINVDNAVANTNFSSSGVIGGVFVGYGALLSKRFYLAGEGFFTNSNADTSTKLIPGTAIAARIPSTYTFGLSLLPGYLIRDTLILYGRVGFSYTHFEVIPSSPAFRNVNFMPAGGEFGLGLQYAWSSNVQLRGEYDYTTYRSFSALGNKIVPHSNMLTAAIIYVLG